MDKRLDDIADKCLHDLGSCTNDEQCLEVIKDALKTYAKKSKPAPDPAKEEAFREFWYKYGKRVAKSKAYKIFMNLKQDEIDQILATVETFVRHHSELQYRPHPTTYLNQRRWEDEFEEKPKQRPAKENTWIWQ